MSVAAARMSVAAEPPIPLPRAAPRAEPRAEPEQADPLPWAGVNRPLGARLRDPGSRLYRLWLPLAVLLASLGLALWAAHAAQSELREKTQLAFDKLIAEGEQRLLSRMHTYEVALLGAAGFIAASEFVTRGEWNDYVNNLDIARHFPGVSGFGYIERVPADGLAEYERQVRLSDGPAFRVRPVVAGDEHYVIRFLMPERGNTAALGFDIASEARRKRAADLARDTGRPRLSQNVILVQDQGRRPGFLLLVPVRRPGASAVGPVDVMGWTFAPFVGEDFLRGAIGGASADLDFAVYDGARATPTALIHAEPGFAAARATGWERVRALQVAGRTWTVVWRGTPAFARHTDERRPLAVLATGVAGSLLLAAVIWALTRSTRQARRLAERMTEDLRVSENRFRSSFEFAATGMALGATDGRFLRVNRALSEITGHSKAELLGLGYHGLLHPDDRADAQHLQAVLSGDTPVYQAEQRYLHKLGHPVWVIVSVSPVRDDGGVQYFIAQVQDISARKLTEQALLASEEKNRLVITTAADAFVAINEEGRVVDWNPQAEVVFGWKRQEAISQDAAELIIPPEFRDAHRQGLAHFVATGRSKVLGRRLELQGQRRDGTPFPVELTVAPIPFGNRYLFGAFVRDISDRRLQERALTEKTAELERSNEELEQFAYVASHDLQEPLRSVSGFLQLLSRRYSGRLDADADEFIRFAVDGAARMQVLIQDLLSYSRVGTRAKVFMPVAMEAVLTRALANLREAVAERQAVITHDPLPEIWGDEVQLTQLLQNLIGNALKFTHEAPRVHLGATRDGECWRFAVRDNGIGIAPEYAERVFVIFQRLHGRGEFEGTGIGLAVCKKIVERHGGNIGVEPGPGGGSVFYFTLTAKGD